MDKNNLKQPRLVVFSTLFPNTKQPNAGVFIRERMFRVGKYVPLIVVAPVAWFPGQAIIRRFKPHFRPEPEKQEIQQGITVYHPRFFSIPGVFKWLDGYFLAAGSYFLMKKLKKEFSFNIIDSHFAYPDGFAATLLGKWLTVPVTITLRGTEIRHAKTKSLKHLLINALKRATRVFSVSASLRNHVINLGIPADKVRVIGNGVDTTKFYPLDRTDMRSKQGLKPEDKVLITVGGLVERKGFHRVIEAIPALLKEYPNLKYLVVGGPCAEGDWTEKLQTMVKELNLQEQVRFLGPLPPEQLKDILSAADVFVLSTRNEGWANVILEAMACGLPVIATDVGGNAEVVKYNSLGTIVPFDDKQALENAVNNALQKNWDKEKIIQYAKDNSWDNRVEILLSEFRNLVS